MAQRCLQRRLPCVLVSRVVAACMQLRCHHAAARARWLGHGGQGRQAGHTSGHLAATEERECVVRASPRVKCWAAPERLKLWSKEGGHVLWGIIPNLHTGPSAFSIVPHYHLADVPEGGFRTCDLDSLGRDVQGKGQKRVL